MRLTSAGVSPCLLESIESQRRPTSSMYAWREMRPLFRFACVSYQLFQLAPSAPVLSNDWPFAAALVPVPVVPVLIAPVDVVPVVPDMPVVPVCPAVPVCAAAFAPVLLLVLPPVSAANVGAASASMPANASAVAMGLRCIVMSSTLIFG